MRMILLQINYNKNQTIDNSICSSDNDNLLSY